MSLSWLENLYTMTFVVGIVLVLFWLKDVQNAHDYVSIGTYDDIKLNAHALSVIKKKLKGELFNMLKYWIN